MLHWDTILLWHFSPVWRLSCIFPTLLSNLGPIIDDTFGFTVTVIRTPKKAVKTSSRNSYYHIPLPLTSFHSSFLDQMAGIRKNIQTEGIQDHSRHPHKGNGCVWNRERIPQIKNYKEFRPNCQWLKLPHKHHYLKSCNCSDRYSLWNSRISHLVTDLPFFLNTLNGYVSTIQQQQIKRI